MYKQADIKNIFDAPVYYIERTCSTMNDAKTLVDKGVPFGTFIYAGEQSEGRGRLKGRVWHSNFNENLLGTVLLKQNFETSVPLKIGLAVALTADIFLPKELKTAIKWPNDILINGKKAAGILCETYKGYLLAGTGVNILQKEFSEDIKNRAVSIASAAGKAPAVEQFIKCYLKTLYSVLNMEDWHNKVNGKLWKKNETVKFMQGQNADIPVEGVLTGITEKGAVIIETEKGQTVYYSGELSFDYP
ncbi:biotin--[acetyl-CoA-carboxylase] ligase [Treponema pedis]|uniref:biotin--[biotin carboxyl-carrier protein] ligase n=1 Tax=Treponema pedis str. T A4 TaxID=1291379 RepID=S5ZPE7_9SPIR|nr:biotin--[acetyl-CoA-carboxylase] ligase [Treponema pedis]AGT44497.1 biotin/acetyl-CoA-carboxylase ligase [Treponema pedis str. T A4]